MSEGHLNACYFCRAIFWSKVEGMRKMQIGTGKGPQLNRLDTTSVANLCEEHTVDWAAQLVKENS